MFLADDWASICVPVTHQMPWMFFVFVCFQFVTSFGLLNIIIGLIVDATMQNRARHELEMTRDEAFDSQEKQSKGALLKLFNLADRDKDAIFFVTVAGGSPRRTPRSFGGHRAWCVAYVVWWSGGRRG